jgi:predicted CopG family antitoxin
MKPPLQIAADVFREWLLMYFDAMHDMENEVMVYRSAIELLKQHVGAPQDQEIEALIQKIRKSEDIKQMLDEKYERYRRKALECIEQGSLDQALLQYLAEWKAKGPTN